MIHMRHVFEEKEREILSGITYLIGDAGMVERSVEAGARQPFDEEICELLDDVSARLMKDVESRAYPEVVTLAFWLRRASLMQKRSEYEQTHTEAYRTGRGLAFHIAPSNVPVNFAYSLAAGLLSGNRNIVRVPSREFDQVSLIVRALDDALTEHEELRPFIILVRYGHEQAVNDLLSSVCDTRIIWGGDETIEELRRSPLRPRGTEITFADRYSLAVIDADEYLEQSEDAQEIARRFYNDTYLTDQNACTSPRVIVWTGKRVDEAKELFWNTLHGLVRDKYHFQDIQGVNKYTSAMLIAADMDGVRVLTGPDNLVMRVYVPRINSELMRYMDNSGFFIETECNDPMELKELCDDMRCQTIAMLGDRKWLEPLIRSGVCGIDRVTEIGHTMDFDLIWDGYDLMGQLTRVICGI